MASESVVVDEGGPGRPKGVPEIEEEEISSIYLLEVASLEPVQEVVVATGSVIEITAAPSGAPFWWASSSRCSRSSVGRCSSSVGPSRRPTNFEEEIREMVRALNKQKSEVLQKLGFQPNDSLS